MTFKEYMIKTLHKLYRDDEWINELYNSVGLELDQISAQVKQDIDNVYFDTLSETAAQNFEKDLDIKPSKNQSLEDRGKVIQSKWMSKSFASLPVIQAIADTFYPVTDIICKYADAEIEYEVHHHLPPLNADAMVKAVDEIKPAHIGYKFTYVFNLWRDYYDPLDWSRVKLKDWDTLSDELWSDQAVGKKTWAYCKERTWGEMITKEVE